MKKTFVVWIYLFITASIVSAQKAPETIVLDGEVLLRNRTSAEKAEAVRSLSKEANKIVSAGKFYSVMNKDQLPPSGDKHDYMSQAPYWWADPSKPNGLPYIRRDGEVNPELKKITDKDELGNMIGEAELTALAYFFTGREEFAVHSAKLLRMWFIDPKTLMNPNLKFGQGIPGINKGRGIGIIETRELYRVIDAAILLKNGKSWSEIDHTALKNWFSEYAKWLTESDLGRDEAKAKNNHGTHYDAQLISFLIFTEQTELAGKQIEISKKRIVGQLEKDGSMPLELERTLSWNYSLMNLYGFFTIARLAEKTPNDLWNFELEGKGLKKAVGWLIPYAKGEKKWTYQQIKEPKMDNAYRVFSLAAEKYKLPEYKDLAKKIGKEIKLEPLEILSR